VTEFTLGIPVRPIGFGFLSRFVHVLWTARVQDERGGILRAPIEKVGRDSLPAWRITTPVSRPGRGRRRAQNDN